MTAAPATGVRVRDFLARVLGAPLIEREYPLVFDPRCGGGETLAILEEEEVRAACTLLVRDFRLGDRLIRGGLIGSIATDPAWRGRGLATRLVAQAEDELRARGCIFALLWADDPGFYLRRGWSPFGTEHDSMLVSELARVLPEPSGVRERRPGDEAFIHRQYMRHPARVERTLAETRALLDVPGVLTLVRERAAAPAQPPLPVAYACLGRGRDLADVIHEWAGEPEDVLALLRAHLERRFPGGEAGALFLMAPPCASELAYRLATLGAPAQRGILGLGKLLDLSAAGALLGESLGAPDAVALRGDTLLLRGPRAGTELDADALQALLFGSPTTHPDARALLARLGFETARLPLEPFAFGLDSI